MKKFKYVLLAVAVVALAAALAGCSSSSGSASGSASGSGSASASASSASTTQFIVGFDAEFEPFGYKADDGSYVGFDLELAQKVCEMNGWEYVAKPIDWDSKDLELNSGNITCIWNGFTYEEREDQYAWSGLYYLNAQVFVVAADSDITSYGDMGGKKVLAQAGSAAYNLLTDTGEEGEEHEPMSARFDGGEVLTAPDYNTAFMQLESGAVDVVAVDLTVANAQMAHKEGAFKQLDEALNSEHYAVGFKLGEDEMAAKVTESLKKLDEDGTVKELCEKYGLDYEAWVLK